jgi:hypothetical protein
MQWLYPLVGLKGYIFFGVSISRTIISVAFCRPARTVHTYIHIGSAWQHHVG